MSFRNCPLCGDSLSHKMLEDRERVTFPSHSQMIKDGMRMAKT